MSVLRVRAVSGTLSLSYLLLGRLGNLTGSALFGTEKVRISALLREKRVLTLLFMLALVPIRSLGTLSPRRH
jgi:hypothetical protein